MTPADELATRMASSKAAIELWRHYEDVAMHFNDLLMKWRLQAVGGLAAIATAGGFVVRDADPAVIRYRAMFLLSGLLATLWVAVASIDLFYYRKLLHGAVDALLVLEKQLPDVQLSTRIEERAKVGAAVAPWAFYLLGLAPLVMILAWAAFNLLCRA